MKNFSTFLLLAVLKDKLEKELPKKYPAKIASASFLSTVLPHKADFFSEVDDVDNPKNYLAFATNACKLVLNLVNGGSVALYFYFRNKKDSNNCFTEPSSYEIGVVNANGKYARLDKAHYNIYKDWTLENNKENRKKLISSIITDIMDTLDTEILSL